MLFAPALLALALQTPAQSAPAASLADLVPKGTVAFVQAPSLERAAKFVERLGNAFGPSGGQTVDVAKLLAMIELPGDATAVDPARPVGICLVLGEGESAQPLPAFLIPVRNADAFLKSVQQPGSPLKGVAKGGYACIGMGAAPELPSVPAAIARGLPEGELAARLDLGRLLEQFRDQIEDGLNQVESQMYSLPAGETGGLDPAPVVGAYMDEIRDLVDSVETLDVAARLEGDELELGFALTNAEGSAMAGLGSREKTGVRSLAGLLDTDSSLHMLMGVDMAAMLKRFQPLFDAMPAVYPEPLRPAMKQMFDHMADFYGFVGTAQAVSMDFTGTGMRYRLYSQGGDPLKLLEVYRKLDGVLPGFGFTPVPEREVAGIKVNGVRIKFDIAALAKLVEDKDAPEAMPPELGALFEKFIGKDGIALQVASKDGTSLMVVGGDDDYLRASIARLSSNSPPPPFLARALQQVGDTNPCIVLRYDLGRMMKGMKEVIASIAPGEAVGFPDMPLSITAWGGIDGRVWRGALSTNLSELAALTHMRDAKPDGQPRAKADITSIRMALDEYAINNGGKYPDSLEPLVTPDANGQSYLEGDDGKIPKDPWGHEYQYEQPRAGHPMPRVFSFGSDGASGGTGDAADIDSDKLSEK